MNIIPIDSKTKKQQPQPKQGRALFSKMESALKSADADFEKSIRIAKTLAPLLNDQTSNELHLQTIASFHASIKEKVIAILMLGFPKNRPLLPTLKNQLISHSEALRIASVIAISQMRDGKNNELLCDILIEAFKNEQSSDVRRTIRQSILLLIDKKTAAIIETMDGSN